MPDSFSGVSSALSGTGTWSLSGVTGLIPPPLDGFRLFKGALEVRVTSFDGNLIWNAVTATQAQLRGGRFLLMDRSEVKGEYFVNRTGVFVPRVSAVSLPADASSFNTVGDGDKRITVNVQEDGYIHVTDVRYQFEPGVQVRIFFNGGMFIHYNQEDEYTYSIQGVNAS